MQRLKYWHDKKPAEHLYDEVDYDKIEMQDHKFTVKELVDIYSPINNKLCSYQVEIVLDEMIMLQPYMFGHD